MNPYGEYDQTANPVNVDLGDDFWEETANEPNIPKGTMTFYIDKFEAHPSTNGKDSYGFDFYLVPYLDQYDTPVSATIAAKPLKTYFYAGKARNGKIYDSKYTQAFKTLLISLDVTQQGNKRSFTQDSLRGLLVKGNVIWDKYLSNKEHPQTGRVPTVIDDNDPYTYGMSAKVDVNTVRGVRDTTGEVKRIGI